MRYLRRHFASETDATLLGCAQAQLAKLARHAAPTAPTTVSSLELKCGPDNASLVGALLPPPAVEPVTPSEDTVIFVLAAASGLAAVWGPAAVSKPAVMSEGGVIFVSGVAAAASEASSDAAEDDSPAAIGLTAVRLCSSLNGGAKLG